MEEASQISWFVMRDLSRPNALMPAYKQLANMDVEFFTPMKTAIKVVKGKKSRVEVPVIHDLLFLHGIREALDEAITSIPKLQYRFKKGVRNTPIIVPEADMQRFIHAVNATDNPKYFLPGELTPSMCGRDIRIIGGALNDYEGKLLSIRGSRKKRIIVELPGFLSVGIEVDPAYISFI